MTKKLELSVLSKRGPVELFVFGRRNMEEQQAKPQHTDVILAICDLIGEHADHIDLAVAYGDSELIAQNQEAIQNLLNILRLHRRGELERECRE